MIMENKIENQTPIDLYLMIPHEVFDKKLGTERTKICLVSCKEMKSLQGILPTKEILETHFSAERVKIQISKRESGKDDTYIPQPLQLEIDEDLFKSIVEEAYKKDHYIGDPSILALTLGNSMPCCLITIKDSSFDKELKE